MGAPLLGGPRGAVHRCEVSQARNDVRVSLIIGIGNEGREVARAPAVDSAVGGVRTGDRAFVGRGIDRRDPGHVHIVERRRRIGVVEKIEHRCAMMWLCKDGEADAVPLCTFGQLMHFQCGVGISPSHGLFCVLVCQPFGTGLRSQAAVRSLQHLSHRQQEIAQERCGD